MSDESRRRWRDAWQLHLPLVLVLALCTVLTIVEFRRANEGVGRAWVYTFQWPIIGLFGIAIWNRYRRHGSLSGWFTKRYQDRIAKFQADDEAQDAAQVSVDPQEQAWRDYVQGLARQDPPGGPPQA